MRQRVAAVETIEHRLMGADPVLADIAQKRRTFVDADSLTWLSHTRELRESGGWRLRKTQEENVPDGRAIHWSHSVIWLLTGLTEIQKWKGTVNPDVALETAALALNPLILVLGVGCMAWMLYRWMGLVPSMLFMLCLTCFSNVLQTFHPLRPDHHGLQAVLVALTALCWARAGAGWIDEGFVSPPDCKEKLPTAAVWLRPPSLPDRSAAKTWAVLAGFFCGMSFWVGAVVTLPLFWGLCIAGLLSWGLEVWRMGRRKGVKSPSVLGKKRKQPAMIGQSGSTEKSGLCLWPETWRWLGRSAGLTSFGFYLLEYFPAHLRVPLEVNQPLYSLCVWAGTELLAQGMERKGKQWNHGLPALIMLGVISLLPLGLWFFGGDGLWAIKDPVHVRWLEFTLEIRSWPEAFGTNAAELALKNLALPFMAIVVALWIIGRGSSGTTTLVMLSAPVVLAGGMLILSWHQVRWLSSFSLISWLLISMVVGLLWALPGRGWKWAGATAGLLVGSWCVMEWLNVQSMNKDTTDSGRYSAVVRKYTLDKYLALEFSLQGKAELAPHCRMLCHFGFAPALRYYARVPVVASLYWENVAGMRFTAAALGASTDEEARRLLHARGITHVMTQIADDDVFMYDALHRDFPIAKARTVRSQVFLGRLAEGRTVSFLSSEPWMEQVEASARAYRIAGRPLTDRNLIVRKVIASELE